MGTESIDYAAIIADLEAKRAALDATITAFRSAHAAGALGVGVGDSMPGMAGSVSVALHGGEVPAGAFNGLSIPAAAKLYLSIVKKKQTTKEIADALRQGGMETAGKNFEVIVGSALYRISDPKNSNREVVRVKGAWGLAQWWPAGVRASQGKPNSRKAKKARKQKSASAAATTATPHAAGKDGHLRFPREKPQERIAQFLRNNPAKIYTPQEVSQELGIDTRTVAPTLGRLVSGKLAEKVELGKYRAAQNHKAAATA
ncbi:MAG TPA: hypothetical protein VHF01_17465 [Candidatus Acidoferrum sp.]|nr:hypothetical protein [Candidatus Acidoferrum sp.]